MILNQLYLNSYLDNLICFEKKPHIAVGVSGGPDSMCITHLLNRWIKLKKGKLSALVFDHGIRNNSKEESLQVREMLTKNLIFFLNLIDVDFTPIISSSFIS